MKTYLLANFGGPRHLEEIPSFLVELLRDQDVIRSRFPKWIHDWLFGRIARKRALSVRHDYEQIGGKSPIYFDTEKLASILSDRLQANVLTFHRYLPSTHLDAVKKIENDRSSQIIILPLFPQFCYATTGSIARFFSQSLTLPTLNKLRWIKSYAAHPAFIHSYWKRISNFLKQENLREEKSALLFSAHGIPESFVEKGDIYESECILSYKEVLKGFPNALGRLSYQSKFGPEEWIKPYTNELCETILDWHEKRENIVFVPISFTSDHIETLFEIEKLYLPPIISKGLKAYRCPALNLEPYWIDALVEILAETNLCANQMLIRK